MIFPTLEGLTVQEQEEYERQQLMAHGRWAPPASPKKPRPERRERAAPRWKALLFYMQPGVQYAATTLMEACGLSYGEVRRAMLYGALKRSGTRKLYRFELAQQVPSEARQAEAVEA